MLDKLVGRYVRHLNQRLMNFSDSAGPVSLPAPDPDKQYLLYLHVPFCVVLCPFCSFHRVEFQEDKATQYFHALQNEIRLVTEQGYRFGEVYIGGGTPTVMPDLLADTVAFVKRLHPVGAVSVETNPHDLNESGLSRLRESGVNRLSVGVQSFDNDLLAEMERIDKYGSGDQIAADIKRVNGTFDTLNVDMIFNFPHQDQAILATDLGRLTEELAVDQVSWYPLMTSATTSRRMSRSMGQVDYARERAYYQIIVAHMLSAGYQRSSAWCFSRQPGMFDEYIVEHEEYVGLGSGAFSYVDGGMFANTFSINHYLARVSNGESGIVRQRRMNALEQMRYYLLMRLFGGSLDLDVAEARFGGRFERTIWRDLSGLRMLGALQTTGRVLRLTEAGQYLWVVLMREFFSGVNTFRDDMRHHISAEVRGPEFG